MSKEIEYWEGRGRWLDSRSEGHDATCDQCGRTAVLVTLDGEPVRAYHPYTVDLVSEPCPALMPMLGVEGNPLSSDVLPENVTVRPYQQPPGMNDWATYPICSCSTCEGGGCPDCTDPVG